MMIGISTAAGCIDTLRIDAVTGDRYYAGHDPQQGANKVGIVLKHGETYQAEIPGTMKPAEPYSGEIHVWNSKGKCVSHSDIQEVHLLGTSCDGWYIASISTYTKTAGGNAYKLLTSDPNFQKWVDKDQEQDYPYNAKDLPLSLKIPRDIVDCGYGKPSCECKRYADECEFDLEVDEIRTFTSYQKLSSGEGLETRDVQGVVFYLGDDGNPYAANTARPSPCLTFGNTNCTDPLFVDGKTYRLALAVNGQIPGPTIIVHENQTVILNVKNNLTTEVISIHWHGMHQIGTPWMDGVGQVTQCQIGPSSTFQYKYLARPSGTFWYHSHSGAQRTDGLYGSLIVRESTTRLDSIRNKLPLSPTLRGFEDHPGQHTLSFLDWQQESSLDLFTQISAGLGFHPDNPIGEVPTDSNFYNSTLTYDGTRVGPVPYYSGLINGKGRHKDVDYNKTRLSVFYVERGKVYRFRLVGAQGLYQYKFSIDGHKLTLVGTDGYWTLPEKQVDYIIIHTGERYDFLLEANATERNNFWIRGETMETINEGNPPYSSVGNVAEAILHYTQANDTGNPDIDVPSTQYEDIKNDSPASTCTSSEKCRAVNCPFRNFHSSYNINCTNIEELKLLELTPNDQLPMAYPDADCPNCTRFFNFHFEGASATASINGRNFILPSFPPQTQHQDFLKHDTICNISTNCNPSTIDCLCTHVYSIPYDKTIQFIWSGMGSSSHPIHLHGHTFHVVHVGYPEYNDNAEVKTQSSDIRCADANCTNEGCDPNRCTMPSWNGPPPTIKINPQTIRKDTVVIPAWGYVMINFISDNPGYWFMHCHKETHQLEGMAAIINEAFERQGTAPSGMNKCGDFTPWKSTTLK